MAINRVQFQAGLSMAEFMQRYGTQAQCLAALRQARWPEGFRCPRCQHARCSIFEREGRGYWQCCRCRHQTSALAGTIFQASKLPLTRWFLAMHLITQAKNNVSALELKRHLGVGYAAAWRIKHKLMQTMAQREARRILSGRIELDDAYLGGERRGKTGRGSENKIPFVIAVQTSDDGRPQYVQLTRMPFTRDAISAFANRSLSANARVLSDGLPAFRVLGREVARHQRIVVGSGRQAVEHPEFRRVNTVLGNLKTAISGTYHAFNFAKYADRYLAEAQYRFNRRFDLQSILARLLWAAASTLPCPEPQLRLAEVQC